MNKATLILGAWAVLAALPSAASACESGTLSQAANAHGLSAPYMPAPPAADYACAAQPVAAAGVAASRRISLAGVSSERRGRGRSAGAALRNRRFR